MNEHDTGNDVAVVGMSCRVAGADTWQQWWKNLLEGRREIRPVPAGRLAGLETAMPEVAPAHAALLDDITAFDASFFGLSRRAAAWMDPQQRAMLELSWHALETAGIVPDSLRGQPVAVFAATWVSEYRERMAQESRLDATAAIGTLPTFLANRLSYQYGLTGPSMAIDTACSAGLTALALAVRGIQHGDFPMAIVGSVNVLVGSFLSATGYLAGLLSRSGASIPFGTQGDGYIRGEGGACVVLKSRRAAEEAGDPILAVIRGVAMNHDGAGGGLTGPDAESHGRLIADAIGRSGVPPESLGYLEAHGPGTRSGDPVEIRGLRTAIGEHTTLAGPEGRLWVGSAKGNVGHLEAAAGLIGLVKAVMTLRHERIVAIPGLTDVNPEVDVAGSAIRIADRDVSWPARPGTTRRAAVSSFGLGGSNAHAVIEEAPPTPPSTAAVPADWLPAVPISARSEAELVEVAHHLSAALSESGCTPAPDFSAVVWTLQAGRTHHDVRRLVRAANLPALAEVLRMFHVGSGTAVPESADSFAREELAAWLGGRDIDWSALWPTCTTPTRVALPGYPFHRTSHWFSKQHPTAHDIPTTTKELHHV